MRGRSRTHARLSAVTQIGAPAGEHTGKGPRQQTFQVRWAGATDTGLRRAHNEDSLVTVPPVFAIADGMVNVAHSLSPWISLPIRSCRSS